MKKPNKRIRVLRCQKYMVVWGLQCDSTVFDFSLQLSYQLGGKYYDRAYQAYMHNGNSGMQGTNWSTDIRKAWTPDNRYTDVPRLSASDASYQQDSSRFLVSSDYLSLNNITLGYTIPKRLTSKLGLSHCRVYLTADNVALFIGTQRS